MRLNKHFFLFTIFRHSLSNSKQERLITALRNPLDLNTAEVTAEVVLALQRAIPRLCKFGGNDFLGVMDNNLSMEG